MFLFCRVARYCYRCHELCCTLSYQKLSAKDLSDKDEKKKFVDVHKVKKDTWGELRDSNAKSVISGSFIPAFKMGRIAEENEWQNGLQSQTRGVIEEQVQERLDLLAYAEDHKDEKELQLTNEEEAGMTKVEITKAKRKFSDARAAVTKPMIGVPSCCRRNNVQYFDLRRTKLNRKEHPHLFWVCGDCLPVLRCFFCVGEGYTVCDIINIQVFCFDKKFS